MPASLYNLTHSLGTFAPVVDADFQRWTRAIASGDAAAFALFYDRYSKRVFGFALTITSGHDCLARDVHQLAMIKAARSFRAFESEQKMLSWLRAITRNVFIDQLRKEAVFHRVLERFAELGNSQEEDTEASGLLIGLAEALKKIPIDDQQLLDAIYRDRRSHKTIADEMDTTAKAIERRLARIRDRLRAIILSQPQTENCES
jgi:RNA polymerase sigma-70 factor (ECF subfamily)